MSTTAVEVAENHNDFLCMTEALRHLSDKQLFLLRHGSTTDLIDARLAAKAFPSDNAPLWPTDDLVGD